MLFTVISLVDFLGMGVSLWLALYLLGSGFSSRITLRGVVVLLAFAAFFLVSYVSLYKSVPGVTAIRAILFTASLLAWSVLTYKLLPMQKQKGYRWLVGVIYAFGFVTVIALASKSAARVGQDMHIAWMTRAEIEAPFEIYGLFQLFASASIVYNLYIGRKAEAGVQNRTFVVASLLAVSTVGYFVLVRELTSSLINLIADALIFSTVIAFGISLERYQTLIERRRTPEDFVITSLAVFWLSAIYIFVAWKMGFSPLAMIVVAILSILTHSTYNLLREFLNRLRLKDEYVFHHQLRSLQHNPRVGMSLQERLKVGLKLLCQTLEASGAFIAIQDEGQPVVLASYHCLPIGSRIPVTKQEWKDVFLPPPQIANQVTWLAPACQGEELIALIGIGAPSGRPNYSESDLNLLAETASRMEGILYLYVHEPVDRGRLIQIIADAQVYEANPPARSNEWIHTPATNPDSQFVKMVEDGLRNLSDFISLGQSSLPEHLGVSGANQIERGKAVQQKLIEAIEVLRPAQDDPAEPIPREWYSYIILHDAYQNQIPNHDIMSKLYISEGTFHRTRRAAVRAVAHALLEMQNLYTTS